MTFMKIIKYEKNFNERLTFYDNIKVNDNIIDNLNEIGENIVININFINRLYYRIYNQYVDGDHLLLRFILSRGAFRNDINDKCILFKNCDSSQEHVFNECAKTKKLRIKLPKELNDLIMLLKIKHFWILFSTSTISKIFKLKKEITNLKMHYVQNYLVKTPFFKLFRK